MCVYKGTTYTLGQKWSDGCKYNCECVDGNTGRYVCKEKWVLMKDKKEILKLLP